MHWFWIVPLVLLIFFTASPRFRGDIAESRVRRILAAGLGKNRYTVLNDVTIPSGGGTVHIDHLVVSKYGIFVIESQYARGWISGGEFQERWKQHHPRRVTRLDNPVHRNALQLQALERLLKVPASKFHPVVVMVGQKGFKTPPPANVLPPEKLISHVRSKAMKLLDGEQAARLLKAVEDARVRLDGRMSVSKLTLLRFVLVIALIGGSGLAFRDELVDLKRRFDGSREQAASPDMFHPDGRAKTEQELWEDSLVCAHSSDTGRCSCYERGGPRVEIDPAKCRSLAERGSILKQ